MSWSIANLTNTVKVSVEVANALAAQFPNLSLLDYMDDSMSPGENLLEGDVLFFTEDHREHMDWLTPEVCTFLAGQKVQGDITFGSVEGDNKGRFWGYRFDGEGGYVKLKGDVNWTPV